MGKSFRKTPIGPATFNGSNKPFKLREHRRERKRAKQLIGQGEYEALPHPKRYGNEWNSPRDGKLYFEYPTYLPYSYLWTVLWRNISIEEAQRIRLEALKKEHKRFMRK